jgi:hypothetical protein
MAFTVQVTDTDNGSTRQIRVRDPRESVLGHVRSAFACWSGECEANFGGTTIATGEESFLDYAIEVHVHPHCA